MVEVGASTPGTLTGEAWPVAGSRRHSSRLALDAHRRRRARHRAGGERAIDGRPLGAGRRGVGGVRGAALEEILQRAGELGLLIAMGPGFCSELVLLRW